MSQIAISNAGRGGRRKQPWVFSEHGIAMLSSVLHSKKAVQVNIGIMRAFVKLCQMLATNGDLARKVQEHDQKITTLFDAVQKLLTPPARRRKTLSATFIPKSETRRLLTMIIKASSFEGILWPKPKAET